MLLATKDTKVQLKKEGLFMKKLVSTALIASLISSVFGTSPILNAEDTQANQTRSVTDLSKYETNDLIVVYKTDANATEKNTMRIASLSEEEQDSSSAEVLSDKTVILKLDSQETLKEAITTFSNDSRVAYIQPNYIYHSLNTNIETIISNLNQNSYYAKQWAYNNDGSLYYTETDYRTTTVKKWPSSGSSSTSTLSVQAVEDIDIDLPEALESIENSSNATGNREAIVALVDTGIMYDHADLADNMWQNTAEINGTAGVDDDGNGYIDDYYGWNFYGNSSFIFSDSSLTSQAGWPSRYNQNGNNSVYNKSSSSEDAHGTHGAGTIAAANNSEGVVGIASNSNTKLMAVKALGGTNGEGSTESVVKGIQYAINNGATIVNLSLGGEEDDSSLRNIIKNNPNVLFTIASGNGDQTYNAVDNDKIAMYPANYAFDNIVSVANLVCTGELHYSSNYGVSTVHIAAPGSYILSTSTGTETSYSRTAKSEYEIMTGTSMAAPMVAGVAAMLYSKYQNLTMNQIRTAIFESSVKLDALSGKIKTGGMLNANEAVKYIEKTYCNTTTSQGSTTTATPTITPTKTPTATATPTISATATPIATKEPTPTVLVTPSVAPQTETTPSATATVAPTSNLKITDVTFDNNNFQLNKPLTFNVHVTGSVGTVTYDFFNLDSASYERNTTGTFTWTPTSSGISTLIVYARDEANGFTYHYTSVTVPKPSVKLTKKGSAKRGSTISVTAKTSNGTSPYTYTFKIYRQSKLIKTITTTKKTIKYKFTKKGTYKIKVIAKDAYKNKVTKTMAIKVKK